MIGKMPCSDGAGHFPIDKNSDRNVLFCFIAGILYTAVPNDVSSVISAFRIYFKEIRKIFRKGVDKRERMWYNLSCKSRRDIRFPGHHYAGVAEQADARDLKSRDM